MKITFQMTENEFYLGWKYKNNTGKMSNYAGAVLVAVICLCVSAVGVARALPFLAVTGICISGAVLFGTFNRQKKRVMQEYRYSAVINGEHTIIADNDRITLINSFEKMSVPYSKIFAFKETKDYLFIMPTFRKGIAVINKERYGGDDLTKIAEVLKKSKEEAAK